MLKVGDILWIFHGNTYYVGEISKLSVVGYRENTYYYVSTNGIIGIDQTMLIPVKEDFNTLVEVNNCLVHIYFTISESVAVNYIKDHFNETDNQRNLQQDASE